MMFNDIIEAAWHKYNDHHPEPTGVVEYIVVRDWFDQQYFELNYKEKFQELLTHPYQVRMDPLNYDDYFKKDIVNVFLFVDQQLRGHIAYKAINEIGTYCAKVLEY